jgi:hypothetical protein
MVPTSSGSCQRFCRSFEDVLRITRQQLSPLPLPAREGVYSDTNFQLLGIDRNITGDKCAALQQRVLQPLGLADTIPSQ